jgi:hypothetical protein
MGDEPAVLSPRLPSALLAREVARLAPLAAAAAPPPSAPAALTGPLPPAAAAAGVATDLNALASAANSEVPLPDAGAALPPAAAAASASLSAAAVLRPADGGSRRTSVACTSPRLVPSIASHLASTLRSWRPAAGESSTSDASCTVAAPTRFSRALPRASVSFTVTTTCTMPGRLRQVPLPLGAGMLLRARSKRGRRWATGTMGEHACALVALQPLCVPGCLPRGQCTYRVNSAGVRHSPAPLARAAVSAHLCVVTLPAWLSSTLVTTEAPSTRQGSGGSTIAFPA